MSKWKQMRDAVVARVRDGAGEASREQRAAAFDNARLEGAAGALVAKVATQVHRVTDADFAAARAAGLSEDQVFELVVCAAVGQSSRQWDAALAALDAVSGGA